MGPNALGHVVAVEIDVDRFEPGAIPWTVRFGATAASSVVPLLDRRGVRALFKSMPADGAPLSLGPIDGPISNTGLVFRAPGDAGGLELRPSGSPP